MVYLQYKPWYCFLSLTKNSYELYPFVDFQWNVLTWYQTFHLNIYIFILLFSCNTPDDPYHYLTPNLSKLRYTGVLLCVTLLWICLLMWSSCWAVRLSALSFRVSSSTNNVALLISPVKKRIAFLCLLQLFPLDSWLVTVARYFKLIIFMLWPIF